MEIIVEKKCGACKVLKPMSDYRIIRAAGHDRHTRDYPANVCRSCENQRDLIRKRKARQAALSRSERTCVCCGSLKPIGMFRAIRELPDGTPVRVKTCEACEASAPESRKVRDTDDLVPAYYPDPLHAVARKWGGPVNPAPLLGLLSLPMPEAEWRMAA